MGNELIRMNNELAEELVRHERFNWYDGMRGINRSGPPGARRWEAGRVTRETLRRAEGTQVQGYVIPDLTDWATAGVLEEWLFWTGYLIGIHPPGWAGEDVWFVTTGKPPGRIYTSKSADRGMALAHALLRVWALEEVTASEHSDPANETAPSP